MGVPLDEDQPFSTNPTSPVPGRSFTRPGRRALLVGARARRRRGRSSAQTLATIDEVRPARDRALQAVRPADRHRRRRPRRRPPARLRPALHDQRGGAAEGRHGDLPDREGHALQRPGLPARLLRRAVPRLAGDHRRGRGGVHHPPRQRAVPGRHPLARRRQVLDGHRDDAAVHPARRRRHQPVRARVRQPHRAAARLVQLPALHPRLLPDRAVRRGAQGRRLDDRPGGRGYVALWSWRPTAVAGRTTPAWSTTG